VYIYINRGCPLSLILFNLFINDILDNWDKYGVNNWFLRLRSGFKYSITIAIRSGKVFDNCLKVSPCCEEGEQLFIHWIFEYSSFSLYRYESLDFIYDLFYNIQ